MILCNTSKDSLAVIAACLGLCLALRAEQNQVITAFKRAVFIIAGFGAAVYAFANIFCLVAEFYVHAVVKDVKVAFPEAIVPVLFTILHYPAIDLVDLFEAAVFHKHA